MTRLKALVVATALSAGFVLAMPAASQAMPISAPVKMQTGQDSNIVKAYYRHHHRYYRYSHYCRWHHCHHRYYAYRYYRPYYYYDPYYYDYDYYYYRPYYHPYYGPGPGFGLYFNVH